jgi:hypothetical protein
VDCLKLIAHGIVWYFCNVNIAEVMQGPRHLHSDASLDFHLLLLEFALLIFKLKVFAL